MIIASDNIDEVIALIKASSNADEARQKLIKKFSLSEVQAKAIVEMRLRQLTGLEQDKLRVEYEELISKIKDLKDILPTKNAAWKSSKPRQTTSSKSMEMNVGLKSILWVVRSVLKI